ncbi:tetratricopeptide repeat protein [Paucilactobacillus sp. N302-9]
MAEKQDSTKRSQQKVQSEQLVQKLVDAIDAQPDKVQNYYDLGSLLTKLNSFEQAEELYMKAIGRFEHDQKSQNLLKYGLGNVYYEVGKYDEAITYYDQISDHKLKADAYLMMAQSLMQKKDYKRAIAYGLTAHDLRKQDPEINQVIGDCLLAIGEFKQAGDFYDQILKFHPGRADTQFNRGLVAMVLGEDYTDYLTQAKQLDPDYYKQSESRIDDIQKVLKNKK